MITKKTKFLPLEIWVLGVGWGQTIIRKQIMKGKPTGPLYSSDVTANAS